MTKALKRRYGMASGADITPVIFRVWPKSEGGDVIALFPTIPNDRMGYECMSFMHVGQHGGADCGGVIARTRAAKPDEYAALKRELESVPYEYKLKVYAREARGLRAARMKAARET